MKGFWERFGAAFAVMGSLIKSLGAWKTLGILVAFVAIEVAIGVVFIRVFERIREGRRQLWQNMFRYAGLGILVVVWIMVTGATVYGLVGDAETAVVLALVVLLAFLACATAYEMR